MRRAEDRPAKRRLGAVESREVILAAAEKCVQESGGFSLKVADVAKRAGTSHSNIIYHFGNVRNLENELGERILVRLVDMVTAVWKDVEGSVVIGTGIEVAFEVFDAPGYANLVAWLLLRRVNLDRFGEAINELIAVAEKNPTLSAPIPDPKELHDTTTLIALIGLCSALGFGLFGSPQMNRLFNYDHCKSHAPAFLKAAVQALVRDGVPWPLS